MTIAPDEHPDDRPVVAAIVVCALLAGAAIWLVRDTTWAIVLLGAFLVGGRVVRNRLERSGRAAVLRSPGASRAATVVLWGALAVTTAWTIFVLVAS